MGESSPFCSNRQEVLSVRPSTLGGVPVFRRFNLNFALSKVLASPTAGPSPILPAGLVSRPVTQQTQTLIRSLTGRAVGRNSSQFTDVDHAPKEGASGEDDR